MERRTTLKLREKDVTRQVLDFLRYEGWTAHRLHTGTGRFGRAGSHVQMNPKGTPDWLFIRPRGEIQNFYAEIKAPGNKLSAAQMLQFATLKAGGYRVIMVDDFEGFRTQYDLELR